MSTINDQRFMNQMFNFRQEDLAVSRSLPTPSAEFPVDLGTDALQQEIGNALIQDHLR